MSDILPQIEPETSGRVTQWDTGHSDDIAFKVALALGVGLFVGGVWVAVNLRKGVLKDKLKLPFRKFRALFKNEWTWRLFLVLQAAGIISIIYLATNNSYWHLFPHDFPDDYHRDGPYWDYLNSRFWTDDHQNWCFTAFIFSPFLL